MMLILWSFCGMVVVLLVTKLIERVSDAFQVLTEIESNADRMYQSVGLNLEQ
jgi:hypothetical protein